MNCYLRKNSRENYVFFFYPANMYFIYVQVCIQRMIILFQNEMQDKRCGDRSEWLLIFEVSLFCIFFYQAGCVRFKFLFPIWLFDMVGEI